MDKGGGSFLKIYQGIFMTLITVDITGNVQFGIQMLLQKYKLIWPQWKICSNQSKEILFQYGNRVVAPGAVTILFHQMETENIMHFFPLMALARFSISV